MHFEYVLPYRAVLRDLAMILPAASAPEIPAPVTCAERVAELRQGTVAATARTELHRRPVFGGGGLRPCPLLPPLLPALFRAFDARARARVGAELFREFPHLATLALLLLGRRL